jgi:hypothetical protein
VRFILKAPFSTAIAIAVGLIVLLGSIVPNTILLGLRQFLLQWAVILAGVALLIGVVNLVGVHWHKIHTRQKGSLYSAVLILSLVGTVLVVGGFGPTDYWSLWIFNYVQLPIEASLMAILAVALAYASARLIRRRLNALTVIFLITVILVFLGTTPVLRGLFPFLSDFLRPWIATVPVTAGARGILLGVALGSVATGLRVLMGSDRPYSG